MMEHALAKIGDADVYAQGGLIAPQNTAIKLTPFPDQPEYTVEINVIIDNDLPTPTSISSVLDGHYRMTWKMRWQEGVSIVNVGLDFAYTDKHDYKINTLVNVIGSPDRYAVDFRYVILRTVKQ